MGGKGSGRTIKFHDAYHIGQRKYQLKYDKTIATIRKKNKCSLKVAQRIHRKREALRTLKQIEEEEWVESSLYTREIVTIMNEENCSIPEAQEIQRERTALRKLEENKNKIKIG